MVLKLETADYDIGLFAYILQDNLDREELLKLIVTIDLAVEDWDFTESLINHFLALKEVGEQELDEDKYYFTPKMITP